MFVLYDSRKTYGSVRLTEELNKNNTPVFKNNRFEIYANVRT